MRSPQSQILSVHIQSTGPRGYIYTAENTGFAGKKTHLIVVFVQTHNSDFEDYRYLNKLTPAELMSQEIVTVIVCFSSILCGGFI